MKHIKTYEQNIGITFQEWLSSKNESPINTTVINCGISNLIDLNGIEKFKNLKELYCRNNKLTSLPDLNQLKNLKFLYCENNKLTSLPDLNQLKNLKELYCYDNKLTSLPDLSQLKNLKYLYCQNNKLPYGDLYGYFEWLDQYIIDNPNSPEAINHNINKYNI